MNTQYTLKWANILGLLQLHHVSYLQPSPNPKYSPTFPGRFIERLYENPPDSTLTTANRTGRNFSIILGTWVIEDLPIPTSVRMVDCAAYHSPGSIKRPGSDPARQNTPASIVDLDSAGPVVDSIRGNKTIQEGQQTSHQFNGM